MIQRLSNRCKSPAATIGFSCLLATLLTITVGCGGSDPPESSVVDPPTPSAGSALAPDSGSRELSGGLEMPAGAIPTPASESSSDKSGGIQMPEEADPATPSDNDGASDSNARILYASWDEIQAAAKSSGKVTVVNLWSLTCEPCLKEFPGLVDLHKEMGDKIACIAVDLDYDGRRTRPPDRYAERVGAFLNKVGATDFPTYISNTPSDDVFAAMNIGSLPAVMIYQADGNVAKVFVDSGETAGFTYEKDIVPLVTDLASK